MTAMAASTSHGYLPLDAAERQIRLLNVWRSPEDPSQVHGALEIASFTDASLHQLPRYCALSWYWGMPGRTKPLILNGSVVQVRETLYSGMLAFTEHIKTDLVWIDAIYIDQSNEGEKSAQVVMMAEIYRNATRVIAWLGDGDANSDLAFRSVKYKTASQARIGKIPPASIQDQHHCLQLLFSRPY